MGNCCSTCRLRRGKKNRISSAEDSGVGAIASGEYRPHGKPYTVNIKRPSWVKEQCSPFDLVNLWPSREDLNREAIRNRFALRHSGREQCKMGSNVINGGERTALHSPSPEVDGPAKVAGSRSSNSRGTLIPRLRKKDSTRTPKYKDEIMLVDNIDRIVEEEIPDEDHLDGACARTPDAAVPRDGAYAVDFTSNGRQELQEAGEHIVKQVEGEVEADDFVCAPLDFKSVSVPNDIGSNFDEIDEEDSRVTQEIRAMLKQVVSTGGVSEDSVTQIPELVHLPKVVSSTGSTSSEFDEDGSAKLYSPDSSTSSIGERRTSESDDQLTKDIEYILDDDIGPDDRKDETSVSEWKQSGGDAVSASLESDLERSAHCTLDDNSISVEESDKVNSSVGFKKLETSLAVQVSNDSSESSVISFNQETLASKREFIWSRDVYLTETKAVNRTPLEGEDGVECVALPEAMPAKSNFASRLEKRDEKVMEENDKGKSINEVTILQFHVESDSIPSRNGGVFSSKSTCLTDHTAQQRGTATSRSRLYGEKSFCYLDFVSELKDELPSAKLNCYGAVPRLRTRNPRRDFDVTAGKCAHTVPRIRRKYSEMAKQSAVQRQNVEEIKINRPESQSVGPGARPNTSNVKKPTCKEELEMKNAFNRVSGEEPPLRFSLAIRAPSGRLCGSRKGSELNTRKPPNFNVFSSRELDRSDANGSFDLRGRKSESPFPRASDSSINKLRPMAARTSKLASSHSRDMILQHARVPRPPTTTKGTNRRPIIFVRPAPNTRLMGVAARRNGADQVDCSPSDENCFERELKTLNDTGVPSMACSKTAVPTDWRQNVACSHPSPRSLYGNRKHKLTREPQNSYESRKSRMSVVNTAANADVIGHRSQRCSFGPSCESENQGSIALIKKSQPEIGKESFEPHIASRLATYRGPSDSNGHAKTSAPELVYNKEELDLMAEIERHWA